MEFLGAYRVAANRGAGVRVAPRACDGWEGAVGKKGRVGGHIRDLWVASA